jgi:flagellar basal body rod protein FlgC
MSSLASIALSGMSAASMRLHAAAHNIANAQTPGFRRQVVQPTAQPEGGVVVSIGSLPAGAGDALIEDVVAQKAATYAFKANVLTLKAQDRLLGSLLDVMA